MYTQCPACAVAFRITPEVLQQARGKVRCGSCHQAFNALDHLSESPPPRPARPPPVAEPTPVKSKVLMDTLSQLSGPETVRIEDTGVEWRVVDEERGGDGGDDSDTAFGDAGPGPAAAGESQAPGVAAPQSPLPLDNEPRYDDNTPLPDDFGEDDEAVPAYEPLRRRDEDLEAPPELDEAQTELKLSDPDDWADLLDEVERRLETIDASGGVETRPAERDVVADTPGPDFADDEDVELIESTGDDLEIPELEAEEPEADDDSETGFYTNRFLVIEDEDGEIEITEDTDDDGIPDDAGDADSAATGLFERPQQGDEDADLSAIGTGLFRHPDGIDEAMADASGDDGAGAGQEEGGEHEDAGAEDDEGDPEKPGVEAAEQSADDKQSADADEGRDRSGVPDATDGTADDERVEDEDDGAPAANLDNALDADLAREAGFSDDIGEIEVGEPPDDDESGRYDAIDSADQLGSIDESDEAAHELSGSELDELRRDDASADEVDDPLTVFTAKMKIDPAVLQAMRDQELGATMTNEDGSPLVETIIMEGDMVRDALAAEAEEEAQLRTQHGDPTSLLDTYIAARIPGKETVAGRVLLGVGSALLLLVLAGQFIHNERERLATHTLFQSTLAPLYRTLGMPVTPDWDIKGWQFEATSGSTGPDDDRLTISSRISNRSGQPLPYPLIHVSLTDRYEEVIGSRMLRPAEYLGTSADPGKPVEAGDNFTATITLAAASEQATGFKLNVCYREIPDRVRCAIEDFKRP